MFNYNTDNELNLNEYNRYSRQLILPQVKVEGQKRIKAAKILCIGAGGLASSALMYLSALGIGTIGIVDNDSVDISNLQRQVIHRTDTLNHNKAFSAKKTLSTINPNCIIRAYPKKLHESNIITILKEYDVVLDCTDNFATRYLLNDAALILNKPIVYGAIWQFEGQVSVFNYKGGPNYNDLYSVRSTSNINNANNCSLVGVIGVLTGLIGIIQATEKIILGLGDVLNGRLLIYKAVDMSFREIKLRNKTTSKDEYRYFKNLTIKNHTINKHSYKMKIFRFKELIKLLIHNKNNEYLLINVGEPNELKNSLRLINYYIPLSQIETRLKTIKQLSNQAHLILLCKTNSKSIIAHKVLKKHDIDSSILDSSSCL
uniref:Probable molybdopterin-synthase adenylyltransferase n=1 Tax=Corynoplastis japonica TaxID=700918 RepID=A0A1X9PTZ9_9RHOD|nr:molybdopterin biosynthesis protein [Corynoplastis japonica]